MGIDPNSLYSTPTRSEMMKARDEDVAKMRAAKARSLHPSMSDPEDDATDS